jgi:pyruvate/2-oxoglutarate dehydrogenase complex dihydrolipoamide dehydrogenase (E3) component
LATEVEHVGVDIRLNKYAEPDDVRALSPDVVIVATGGIPETSFPQGGDDLALSTWDVLAGQARVEGKILIHDAVGGHAALSLADSLSASGADMAISTPDRHLGRAIGGQNVPIYMRNLTRADVHVMTDRALTGIRREGNNLIAIFRHAYTRELTEESADTIIVDIGTESLTDVFDDLMSESRNLGEFNNEALVALKHQPDDANPVGIFTLFKIGDALAARDIHAAILDANRLCRVI